MSVPGLSEFVDRLMVPDSNYLILVLIAIVAAGSWVGHAYWLTSVLNILYGCPLPKPLLRLVRLGVGALILVFPIVLLIVIRVGIPDLLAFYLVGCTLIGLLIYPGVTILRALRRTPRAVRSAKCTTIDLLEELGPDVIGQGRMNGLLRRLPTRHHVFRVDFTDITLVLPGLPAAWEGLTISVLSDLHFHGTPDRCFYDAVIDRLRAGPTPDLVVLAGDYLDSDEHVPWIERVLGRLRWTESGFAVLGNHDVRHQPDLIRKQLERLGFQVVSNRWIETSIRGVRCVVSGHEGPWIGRGPDLSEMPRDCFHIGVAHTPDQFYWAVRQGIGLLLCGHVHGGQIRMPVIGSIFVPSIYGRRFDMGVFEQAGTVMVVGRGLGGKEPLRFRCNPEVIRITLRSS